MLCLLAKVWIIKTYQMDNSKRRMLLPSGNFRLKEKKALLNQAEIPVVTVMDVTETPRERHQKKQKDFLGSKRGYHTLKSQLVADKNTEQKREDPLFL